MIDYTVIGHVKMKNGCFVPLVDIPQMTDERWNQLAAEQAVKHFREQNNREPENLETAFAWQRAWIYGMEVQG